MPVLVRGKRIVEKATGKTVAMAKSHKAAVMSAAIRNRAYHEKQMKRK